MHGETLKYLFNTF